MAAEAEVTKECVKWLQERGWRCIRKQSGFFKRRVRVGEPGMPDWLCLLYRSSSDPLILDVPRVFWLEMKAAGEEISKPQRLWIKAEKEKGALVIIADSLDSLQAQYAEAFG